MSRSTCSSVTMPRSLLVAGRPSASYVASIGPVARTRADCACICRPYSARVSPWPSAWRSSCSGACDAIAPHSLSRAPVCAARHVVRPESCSSGSLSAAAPSSNHRHPGAARPRAACARAGLSTWRADRPRSANTIRRRAELIHSTAESRLCAPFRARLRCGAAC